jgi:hypothetical protein
MPAAAAPGSSADPRVASGLSSIIDAMVSHRDIAIVSEHRCFDAADAGRQCLETALAIARAQALAVRVFAAHSIGIAMSLLIALDVISAVTIKYRFQTSLLCNEVPNE